jgi:hypothetical protein
MCIINAQPHFETNLANTIISLCGRTAAFMWNNENSLPICTVNVETLSLAYKLKLLQHL